MSSKQRTTVLRPGHKAPEVFQVEFIINRGKVITFFSFQELKHFGLEQTVSFHAKKYMIQDSNYICKINGLKDCRKCEHGYWIEAGKMLIFEHINNRILIKKLL